MKQIICTDAHLDLVSEGINRNSDIDRVMNEIIDVAIKENVDHFMFVGDWNMSSKPSVEAFTIITKWFVRLENAKIDTDWLIGNHDVVAERGRKHNLESLQCINWQYINIIDDFGYRIFEDDIGYAFIYLPYMTKARLKELCFDDTLQQYFLQKFNEFEEKYTTDKIVVFSHLDIEGAVQGSEAFMIKGKRQDLPYEIIDSPKVKLIINGHYHSHQKIGEKILCPGSFESNNFGERKDIKGYYIVEY